MADGYLCPECSKVVTATKNNRYRTHKTGPDGDTCTMSSVEIPGHLLEQAPLDGKVSPGVPVAGMDFSKCPHCTRAVKLTRLGYFEPHDQTMRGGDRCPNSGTRFRLAKPTADLLLPGDTPPEEGLYTATHPRVSNQMEVERERAGTAAYTEPAGPTHPVVAAATASEDVSVRNLRAQPMPEGSASAPPADSGASTANSSLESPTTSSSSPWPSPEPSPSPTGAVSEGPFKLGPKLSETISQPWSPFLQPPEWTGSEKPEPMGDYAKELATRIKETFYSYSNRKSVDNRSAQTTLGPSEIGTPCDRRLAMALMGIPAVNPGGDGWASFVGTRGHIGMGEIYSFADAGTGRYAVELPVFMGIPSVPRGTTDLLDRRHGDIIDWKLMGAYSLKKFKLEGPSPTYRTQGHVYGLGAERSGEKVKNVVIVGLPRAGSSLDEMHVWTERYDRKFAQAALDRVQRIADGVQALNAHIGLGDSRALMRSAAQFDIADDCKYCPFHLKGDKEMSHGCPGS